jgi:hypothetical protein
MSEPSQSEFQPSANTEYAHQVLSFFDEGNPEAEQYFSGMDDYTRSAKLREMVDYAEEQVAGDPDWSGKLGEEMARRFAQNEIVRRLSEKDAKLVEDNLADQLHYDASAVDSAYEMTKEDVEKNPNLKKTWENFDKVVPEDQQKFLDGIFASKGVQAFSEWQKEQVGETSGRSLLSEASVRAFLTDPANGLPANSRARRAAEAALRVQQSSAIAGALSNEAEEFVPLDENNMVGVTIKRGAAEGRSVPVTFLLPGKDRESLSFSVTKNLEVKDPESAMKAFQQRDKAISERAMDRINKVRAAFRADPDSFKMALAQMAEEKKDGKVSGKQIRQQLEDMLAMGFVDLGAGETAEGIISKEEAAGLAESGKIISRGIDSSDTFSTTQILPGVRSGDQNKIEEKRDKAKQMAKNLDSLAAGFISDVGERAYVRSLEPLGPLGELELAKQDAYMEVLKEKASQLPETYEVGEFGYYGAALGRNFMQLAGLPAATASALLSEVNGRYFPTSMQEKGIVGSAALGAEGYAKMLAQNAMAGEEAFGRYAINPQRLAMAQGGVRPDGLFGIDWSSAVRDAAPEVAMMVGTGWGTSAIAKGARVVTRAGRLANKTQRAIKAGGAAAESLPQEVVEQLAKRVAGEARVGGLSASLAMSSRAGYDVYKRAVEEGVDPTEAVALGWTSTMANMGLEYPMNMLHLKGIVANADDIYREAAKAGYKEAVNKTVSAAAEVSRRLKIVPQWAKDIGTASIGEGVTEAMQSATDELILRQAVRGQPEFDGWKEEAAAGFIMGAVMRGWAGVNAISLMKDPNVKRRVDAWKAAGREDALINAELEKAKVEAVSGTVETTIAANDEKAGKAAFGDIAAETEKREKWEEINILRAARNDMVYYKKDGEAGSLEAVGLYDKYDSKSGMHIVTDPTTGESTGIRPEFVTTVYQSPSNKESRGAMESEEVKAELDAEESLEDKLVNEAEAAVEAERQRRIGLDEAASHILLAAKNQGVVGKIKTSSSPDSVTGYDINTGVITMSVPHMAETIAEKRRQNPNITPAELTEIASMYLDEELKHQAHEGALSRVERRVFADAKNKDKKSARRRVDAYLSAMYDSYASERPDVVNEAAGAYGRDVFDALPTAKRFRELARMAAQQQQLGKQTEQLTLFYEKSFENLVAAAKDLKSDAMAQEAAMVVSAMRILKGAYAAVEIGDDTRKLWDNFFKGFEKSVAEFEAYSEEFRKAMAGVRQRQEEKAAAVSADEVVLEEAIPTSEQAAVQQEQQQDQEVDIVGATTPEKKKEEEKPKFAPSKMPQEFPSTATPIEVFGTKEVAPTWEQYEAFIQERDKNIREQAQSIIIESQKRGDGKIARRYPVDYVRASNKALKSLGYSYRIPEKGSTTVATRRKITGFSGGDKDTSDQKETILRYMDTPGGPEYIDAESLNRPDTYEYSANELDVIVDSFDPRLFIPLWLFSDVTGRGTVAARNNYAEAIRMKAAVVAGSRIMLMDPLGDAVASEQTIQMAYNSAKKKFREKMEEAGFELPDMNKVHIAEQLDSPWKFFTTKKHNKKGKVYSEGAFVVSGDVVDMFSDESFLNEIAPENVAAVKDAVGWKETFGKPTIERGLAARYVAIAAYIQKAVNMPLKDALRAVFSESPHALGASSAIYNRNRNEVRKYEEDTVIINPKMVSAVGIVPDASGKTAVMDIDIFLGGKFYGIRPEVMPAPIVYGDRKFDNAPLISAAEYAELLPPPVADGSELSGNSIASRIVGQYKFMDLIKSGDESNLTFESTEASQLRKTEREFLKSMLRMRERVQSQTRYTAARLPDSSVASDSFDWGVDTENDRKEWGTLRGQVRDTLLAIFDYATKPAPEDSSLEYTFDPESFPLAIFDINSVSSRADMAREANLGRGAPRKEPTQEQRIAYDKAASAVKEREGVVSAIESLELDISMARDSIAKSPELSGDLQARVASLSDSLSAAKAKLAEIDKTFSQSEADAAMDTSSWQEVVDPKFRAPKERAANKVDITRVRETWHGTEVVSRESFSLPGYHELVSLVWANYYATGKISMWQALGLTDMIARHRESLVKALEKDFDPYTVSFASETEKAAAKRNHDKLAYQWGKLLKRVALAHKRGDKNYQNLLAGTAHEYVEKLRDPVRTLPTGVQNAIKWIKREAIRLAVKSSKGMPDKTRSDPKYWEDLWGKRNFLDLMMDGDFASYALRAAPDDIVAKDYDTFIQRWVKDGPMIRLDGLGRRGIELLPDLMSEDSASRSLLSAVVPIFEGVETFVLPTDMTAFVGFPSGITVLGHEADKPVLVHRHYDPPAKVDPHQERTRRRHVRITLASAFSHVLPNASEFTDALAKSVDYFLYGKGRDYMLEYDLSPNQAPNKKEIKARRGAFVALMQTVPDGVKVFSSPAKFAAELIANPHFRKALDLIRGPAMPSKPTQYSEMLASIAALDMQYKWNIGDPVPLGGLEKAYMILGELVQGAMARVSDNAIAKMKMTAFEMHEKALDNTLADQRLKKELEENLRVYESHIPLSMVEGLFPKKDAKNRTFWRYVHRHAGTDPKHLRFVRENGESVSIPMISLDGIRIAMMNLETEPATLKPRDGGTWRSRSELDELVREWRDTAQEYFDNYKMRKDFGIRIAPIETDEVGATPESFAPRTSRNLLDEVEAIEALEDDTEVSAETEDMDVRAEFESAIANNYSSSISLELRDQALRQAGGIPSDINDIVGATVPKIIGGSIYRGTSALTRLMASAPVVPIRMLMAGIRAMSTSTKQAATQEKIGEEISKLIGTPTGINEFARHGIQILLSNGILDDVMERIKQEFKTGVFRQVPGNDGNQKMGMEILNQIRRLENAMNQAMRSPLSNELSSDLVLALMVAARTDHSSAGWEATAKVALLHYAAIGKARSIAKRTIGQVSGQTWEDTVSRAGVGNWVAEADAITKMAATLGASEALREIAGGFHYGLPEFNMRGRDYQATLERLLSRLAKHQGKNMEGTTKAYWLGSLLQHRLSRPNIKGERKPLDLEMDIAHNIRRFRAAFGQFFTGNSEKNNGGLKRAGIAETARERRFYRKVFDEVSPLLEQFETGKLDGQGFINAVLATLAPNERAWLDEANAIFQELQPQVSAVNAVARGRKIGEYNWYLPFIYRDFNSPVESGIPAMLDPFPRSVSKSRIKTEEGIEEIEAKVASGQMGILMRGEEAVRLGIERSLLTIHGTIPGMLTNMLTGGPTAGEGIWKDGLVMKEVQLALAKYGATNSILQRAMGRVATSLDIAMRSMARMLQEAKEADVVSAELPSGVKRAIERSATVGYGMALGNIRQFIAQTTPGFMAYFQTSGAHAAALMNSFMLYLGNKDFRDAANKWLEGSSESLRKMGSNQMDQIIEGRSGRKAVGAQDPFDAIIDAIKSVVFAGPKLAYNLMKFKLKWTIGIADAMLRRSMFIAEMAVRRGLSPEELSSPATMMSIISTAPSPGDVMIALDSIAPLVGEHDPARRVKALRPSRSAAITLLQMIGGVWSTHAIHMRSAAGGAYAKMRSHDPKMVEEGQRDLARIIFNQMVFTAIGANFGIKLGLLGISSVSPALAQVLAYLLSASDFDDEKDKLVWDPDNRDFIGYDYLRALSGDMFMFLPSGSKFTSGLGAAAAMASTQGIFRAAMYDLGLGRAPFADRYYHPDLASLTLLQDYTKYLPLGPVDPILDWALKISSVLMDRKNDAPLTRAQKRQLAIAVLSTILGTSNVGKRSTSQLMKDVPVNQSQSKRWKDKSPFWKKDEKK